MSNKKNIVNTKIITQNTQQNFDMLSVGFTQENNDTNNHNNYDELTKNTKKDQTMMLCPEKRFDEYLKDKNKNNIQNEISLINNELIQTGKWINIIYYGPNGVGKYSCALEYISKFSQTQLTYEKKMVVETSKYPFVIKMSDIHFEIDLGILGVNSKQLWNDLIKHIYDVLALRKNKHAFILCKNFNEIHSELLDIFYSYMQTTHRQTIINFIILSNSTGFIPTQVLNKCLLIGVSRPVETVYSTIRKTNKNDKININEIENINYYKHCQTNGLQKKLINQIVEKITNVKKYDEKNTDINTKISIDTENSIFTDLRDNIYDIFVSNHNIWYVIWGVINELICNDQIKDEYAQSILHETYCFLELYNNNYRPIYHLERFLYFLAITINEL